MLITFDCPKCQSRIEADAAAAGQALACPKCGATLTVPAKGVGPGATVGGFRIERLLGKGGMGEVYLARQLSMDRDVALKILPAGLTQKPGATERFLSEVRTAARLEHPNIVTAHEAGEDGGVLYLAMAYVRGESLEKRLKANTPFPENEALRIAAKIAQALAYAWTEHRLLHRDIKPANIMLDHHGEPKLMDMGLAKLIEEADGLTVTGQIMGTPNYMSPEQVESRANLDFRADIYSLGATLYHLVTGHVPFAGSSVLDTLRKQVVEPLRDPRQFNPHLSEGCVNLIEKMLAKKAENRHATWAELLADIEAVQAGQVQTLHSVAAGDSMLMRAKPAVGPGPQRGFRRGVRLAAELTIVIVVGVMIALLLSKPKSERGAGVRPVRDHGQDTHAAAPGDVASGEDSGGKIDLAAIEEKKPLTIDLGDGVNLEMVWIPPGNFLMGSPADELHRSGNEVQHRARISKGFYMGKYEVTQAQWEKLMGSNPSTFKGPENPVEQVTWDNCQEFIEKLNARFVVPCSGGPAEDRVNAELRAYLFRLPTEAEWEYACRSGTRTAYYTGNTEADLDKAGWCEKNGGRTTHPVGQKQPNAWGVYDMHGNVWEWCQDWFGPEPNDPGVGGTDPQGPESGSGRVLRGGGWEDGAGNCRSAQRCSRPPREWRGTLGLRLVAAPRSADLAASRVEKRVGETAETGIKEKQPLTIPLGDGVTLDMVWIPAGSFVMGSPPDEPQRSSNETEHQVRITKGFYMGKYEVTQAQWEKVMGGNPSALKDPKNPVEQVSWEDCQEFIRTLNSTLSPATRGLTPVFRLPTEAEWEYACRAGTKTAFNFGSDGDLLCKHGNYRDRSCDLVDGKDWWEKKDAAHDDGFRHMAPVGSFPPNAWGLYDMHGNVWEWCQDWYGAYGAGKSEVQDPAGPAQGSDRVRRGGSWYHAAGLCRAAQRGNHAPGNRDYTFGLRVVAAPPVQP